MDARVAKLKQFEAEFAKLPADPDRDLVLSTIRAGLLEYQTVRSWERNPDIYSSGITGSAFTIMSRTFAPPEARLRSLIERERQMPQVLAAARANLKNPPKIYTEIAIEQVPGIIDFFRERRSAGVQERDRPEAAGGFPCRQRRRDQGAAANTRLI